MWNYKCDRCGCALGPGERCDCGEAPANDKEVYTGDTFDYGKAKIGDYVSQDVVDNAVNCLPPACMRSDCTQLGEPYSHREDPNSGKWRPVFATFKRITYAGENSIWQFCGYCFAGENTERGKDPVYV